MRSTLLLAPLSMASLVLATGCGGRFILDDAGAGGAGSSVSTSSRGVATTAAAGPGDVTELFPNAPPLPGEEVCVVRLRTNIPIESATHVELCSDVTYATNPPAGGPHWPRWAAYGAYDTPLPHELVVHDLEHGAIVFFHRCAGCDTDVRDAFTRVIDAFGGDPACLGRGSVSRTIVMPDPTLDAPIALAAWGATYEATCIDEPSLLAFVEAHYARGPEDTCAEGIAPSETGCDG